MFFSLPFGGRLIRVQIDGHKSFDTNRQVSLNESESRVQEDFFVNGGCWDLFNEKKKQNNWD
jgi:hypothetical protein